MRIHVDDELAVSRMTNCITKKYLAAKACCVYLTIQILICFFHCLQLEYTLKWRLILKPSTNHALRWQRNTTMPCCTCIFAMNGLNAHELQNYWISAGYACNSSPKAQQFHQPSKFNSILFLKNNALIDSHSMIQTRHAHLALTACYLTVVIQTVDV